MKKVKFLFVLLFAALLVSGCKTEVDLLHQHTFSDEWSFNETYHWHVATCEHSDIVKDKALHNFDAGTLTKAPTEEEEGTKTYKCLECGYQKTESIPKLVHVHTYSEAWTFDETYHWHNANCGHTDQISGKAEHTWDDGQVITPATCVYNGVKEYNCTTCGATKYETIIAEGHKWDDGKITILAGPENKGEKTFTCLNCPETYTVVIHDESHHMGEYIYNEDSTADSDGTETSSCQDCDYSTTRTSENTKWPKASYPSFSKVGTVEYGDLIEISCATSGAVIYYTMDGTNPTRESTKYTQPFAITENCTVKAIAVKDKNVDSNIAEASFSVRLYTLRFYTDYGGISPNLYSLYKGQTIELPAGPQTEGFTFKGWYNSSHEMFNPGTTYIMPGADVTLSAEWDAWSRLDPPTFNLGYSIDYGDELIISSNVQGSSIYYTTDGTEPTVNSTLYTEPIILNVEYSEIKAIAVKEKCITSFSSRYAYFFKTYKLEFESAHDTSHNPYHTYLRKGQEYEFPELSENGYDFVGWMIDSTLYAAGEKYTMGTSAVTASAQWTTWETVADPVITIPEGIFNSGDTVEMTCSTQGASIYYTTDGSTPTASSLRYTGPAVITADEYLNKNKPKITIKAIALKDRMNASQTVSAECTIKIYSLYFSNLKSSNLESSTLKLFKGETITLPSLADTQDFRFDGWTIEDGTEIYEAGTTYTMPGTGSIFVYASWFDIKPPSEIQYITAPKNEYHKVTFSWYYPADTDYKKTIFYIGLSGTENLEDFVSYDILKDETKTDRKVELVLTDLTEGVLYEYFAKTVDTNGNISAGITHKYIKPYIPITELSAGQRPENNESSRPVPSIVDYYPDNIYFKKTGSYGLTVKLNGNGSTYGVSSHHKWYYGSVGEKWQFVSGSTSTAPESTIPLGTTTYYIFSLDDYNDSFSIAYSNVYSFTCNTQVCDKLGHIVYQTDTGELVTDEDYNAELGTPIGIVCQVDDSGAPTRMMNLHFIYYNNHPKCWSERTSEGYNLAFGEEGIQLSYSDGSLNWQILSDAVSDEDVEENYSAFKFCQSLTDGNKNWYLPSLHELLSISYNNQAIDDAIRKLKNNNALPTGDSFSTSYSYLASSNLPSSANIACVKLSEGSISYVDRSRYLSICAIAKFE